MLEHLTLTISWGSSRRDVTEPGLISIGRDPSCDIVVDGADVSRRHGVVEWRDDGWWYRDTASRNGSFFAGREIDQIQISEAPSTVLLGDAESGSAIELKLSGEPALAPVEPQPSQLSTRGVTAVTQLGSLSTVHAVHGRTVIGRGEDCDLVLTDLEVSRRHAEMRPAGDGGMVLIDLDSFNGTFVNGRRIGSQQLAEGDLVSIGASLLRYTAGSLQEYEDRGSAWLLASGLGAVVDGGREILRDVSFALEPSSLLAVVGPSGAGKSTLVRALSGFGAASSGTVVYGGRDVYANYAALRNRMGYVPQDDLLHTQLQVGKALEYAAELRFPPDVDAAARKKRVDEVISELGLHDRRDVQIERLSGGQRKRVSVALELLTKPSLLFFDEPTSGLDPGNEEHVMALLRELADGGRLVIVVTHSVQSLDLCDRVMFLAPGGTVAYYGPPGRALEYFAESAGADRYATVFRQLDERRNDDWAGAFKRSDAHEEYIRRPLDEAAITPTEPVSAEDDRPNGQTRRRQLSVLTRRYLAVLGSDRRSVLLLTLQAPLFGLLYLALIGRGTMSTDFGPQATMLVWLLVIGATWLGTSNAIREIVKEGAIYRRERSVGLSLASYLGSKVAVLAPITALQTIVMVLIVMVPQHLPPDDPFHLVHIPPHGVVLSSMLVELMVSVVLTGWAAMSLGLLLSAAVRSSDRALMLLPIVLIAQIVASVPFFEASSAALTPLEDVSSAQWGTASAASTVDLNQVRALEEASTIAGRRVVFRDEPAGDRRTTVVLAVADGKDRWLHRNGAWWTDTSVLLLLIVAPLLAAAAALRRRDPSFGRRRAAQASHDRAPGG
jgi:ABC transport system ATP-binding/permease protein